MSLAEHILITYCLELKKKKKQVRKRLLVMGCYLEVPSLSRPQGRPSAQAVWSRGSSP